MMSFILQIDKFALEIKYYNGLMYLNFIDIIIFISASQSLFLSVIIFRKYGKTTANRTLSVLMLSYALVLTQMLLTDIQFAKTNSSIVLLLISTTFLIGPLYYLYTKYLTHVSEKFKKSDLLHFIPGLIYIIVILPVLFRPTEPLPKNMSGFESRSVPIFFLVLNWVIMVQMVAYTILTIGVIRKYSRQIKNLFSNIEKIRLGWLRNLVIMFSAGIMIYIIENMLITWDVISNDYAISSIISSAYIYIFGYLTLLKSEVFASPEFSTEINHIEEIEEAGDSEGEKYLKSGLSDEKAGEHLRALFDLMEKEKPYLDSELTLNKLAELISISPHHLSEVINKKLNQNFFDFVNKYRVEKIKQDLLDPKKQNLTMLAIALDAGFNSKSSFNMIFKKQTGMTPSEFRKKQL
jgi:AraC-like DNA-binding protein